jgi:5-(aminomethyl)-3-furanmethanol phosphate kinase
MSSLHPSEVAVIKVGGSLYDLPDLGPRLRRSIAEQLAGTRVVLVPGGGPLVEAIRHLDRRHGLGEETSHWLALRALSVNAHFLASLLPACVIGDVGELPRAWDKGLLSVLDIHDFARADESRSGRLPHTWAVTSDALAARVAVVLQARQLVLLKSTTIPPDIDWREAGRLGLVDALFSEVLRDAPADLYVRAVNLRTSVNAN